MNSYREVGSLMVDPTLYDFVNDELLPALESAPVDFWSQFERLVAEFAPRNHALLDERVRLQERIDEWHRQHPGPIEDAGGYEAFLRETGYLTAEPDDFHIATEGVDSEIAEIAGPQLVVPVRNARFALNAVNARWGSLYDALYGSDVVPETEGAGRTSDYNPVRGSRVIDFVRSFLDDAVPLAEGSHRDAHQYVVNGGELVITFAAGRWTRLRAPGAFRGYRGSGGAPEVVLLRNNGLHIELHFNRASQVGAQDPASICDVYVEAALTTIVDFEDSVAAVDAAEKVEGYRNWLGIVRGSLTAEVDKGGGAFTRVLAGSRHYRAPDGTELVLPGQALLYVRNVGMHMHTDAVRHAVVGDVPEGILDALVTTAAAVATPETAGSANRTGSVYIVKPKLHSPAEVAFTVDLFAGVERLLGLRENTIKLGLMDEERRLSANLKAGIHAARQRIVFINTGFLDRSGDEIHSCFEAGPTVRKAEMKSQTWISAYERRNVSIGLRAGFSGKAQIGKGMWTMPDLMHDMLEQKSVQLHAGATTAWVPSPTAAVLHAVHYHRVDVFGLHSELAGAEPARLTDLLTVPVVADPSWPAEDIQRELDGNVQSILGYVVRWIDQGIGCSKVPDLQDVALMEDRATLRISSQIVANWLRHGVVTAEQVDESLSRMAGVVDAQNQSDGDYRPLSSESYVLAPAFAAARELIFDGARQPSGYTEPVLHTWRRRVKHTVSAAR